MASATDIPGSLRRANVWIGLIGLGLLVAASLDLERQRFHAWSIGALIAGVLIWIAIIWRDPLEAEDLGALDPPARGPRVLPLLISVAAAGLSSWRMPSGEFRLPGLLLWVVAMASWLWAWRPSPVGRAVTLPSSGARWAARGALVLIVGIGLFFSFFRLARVPLNPISDHAEEMFDMLDLFHGRYPIFFLRWCVGPLHYYWTFLFTSVLGLPLHYLTVKIATAAFGVLAIPAMYLAGRELGGVWLGLSSAGLLAWGKWNFSLSRFGLEYPYAILPTVVVVWALLRFVRRGDRVSELLAGAALGIGLGSYPAFRVVPLLVPLALAAALLDRRRRGQRWRLLGSGFLIAGTAAVVSLPLLKFVFVDPDRGAFWNRSMSRLTGAERSILGAPFAVFAGNLWNMLRAFHWRGASTWIFLDRYDPYLDVVMGGLLFAGVVLLARSALRGAWRWTFLLPAFLILTLPSTLSLAFPDENPSLNRSEAAIPVVLLVTALPLAFLCEGFGRRRGASRAAGFALLAGFCAFSIQQNYHAYFVQFAASYDRGIPHSIQMAETLQRYRAEGIPYSNAYLLDSPDFVDPRNIAFEIDAPDWAETHAILQPRLPVGLRQRPLLFLYHESDRQRLERIQRLYPGSGHIVRQAHPDREFGVYVATGAAPAGDSPKADAPSVETMTLPPVAEQAVINGESVGTRHSKFDVGRIQDLFDGNKETYCRTENATTALIELSFPSPRTLRGVDVTTATMDVGLKAILTLTGRTEPLTFSRVYTKLPPDPTVSLSFDGPKEVLVLRLEVSNLNGGDGHVHVRDVHFQ